MVVFRARENILYQNKFHMNDPLYCTNFSLFYLAILRNTKRIRLKKLKIISISTCRIELCRILFFLLSSCHWIHSPALPNTHSLVQDARSGCHTNDTLSVGKKMCEMRLESETCSPTAAKIPLKVSYRSGARRYLSRLILSGE